jgi:hypothetical protein
MDMRNTIIRKYLILIPQKITYVLLVHNSRLLISNFIKLFKNFTYLVDDDSSPAVDFRHVENFLNTFFPIFFSQKRFFRRTVSAECDFETPTKPFWTVDHEAGMPLRPSSKNDNRAGFSTRCGLTFAELNGIL